MNIYISESAKVTCSQTKSTHQPTSLRSDKIIPTVPYVVTNTSKTGKTLQIACTAKLRIDNCSMLRGLNSLGRICAILFNGGSFCDFLYAFLVNKIPSETGSPLKEMLFFLPRVHSFFHRLDMT